MKTLQRVLLLGGAGLALAACDSMPVKMGDSSAKTVATGAAGGATAENANSQLERCDASLGTLSVVEDQAAPWYAYLQQFKLGSTIPVIRLLIQQSNCFVVVERGAAMGNMMRERELSKSGEMRAGSKFQQGQMVAADYTVNPSITFSEQGTGGMGAGLGGLSSGLGVLGLIAGSLKANEASTTLLLIDNRSGVQLAASEGSAKNFDFNVLGGIFGGGGGAGAGAYSRTPEGKVLVAAFTDSYNQMVRAVRNYKAQTVKGGLGTGGTLGVQGGATAASKELDQQSSGAPAKPAKKK